MHCRDTPPPEYDSTDDIFEICPVARAFEVTGSKWRLIVIRCLQLWGEQRFSELQETTTADSATLTRTLEDLQEQDLVDRRLEDRPIATYYCLTERGEAFTKVMDAFEEWAFEWTAAELPRQQMTD